MSYVLAPLAQADIDEIWDYTCDRWGADQADRYVDLIWDVIARVVGNAQLGRDCGDIRPGYFKINAESHVVFYRLSGADIRVVRILHGRMDFRRHL